MITEKLTEILGGLFETIGSDFGLYIGLGLTVLVFLVGLIVSLVSGGELKKFKSCASAALKDSSPANINANMQNMPIRVKKLYKRAMLTGAKPSDIINVDAAVNTPFAKSGMAKFPAVTAVGAVVAICAGVGISMANSLLLGATEGLIIAASGLLGGLLVLVANVISSLSYKGALKTYEELMDELDSLARGGEKAEQAHEEEPEERPQYNDYARGAAEPESEPVQAYEQPSYEEPVQEYEQPAYEQPSYEQESEPAQATVVVEEQSAEDIAAERARAREEAMAAARAEQAAAQAAAQAEQTKSAAQQRLDELKAQREAQLKAQREALAQQRAAQAAAQSQSENPSVSVEDVIRRIDKIESQGAPIAEMREVAMLLQKERAKPENKGAEQQKRLNEALSKLLKAMSAAQKR